MSLYDAVKLASRQPHARLSRSLSRMGDEYYLFGAPGSTACEAAAKAALTAPLSGQHCYLSGPEPTLKKLRAEPLPSGLSFSDGHALAVPQGWSVLQAANPTPTVVVAPTSAAARFFVLHDGPALYGNQILGANPIRLKNGQADLQVRFTAAGAQSFQELTSTIAHRGQQVSTANAVHYQHFAVESGGQLQTVLPIDFSKYPDGVVSRAGSAYVQGPFTPRSAQTLATELTYQPLRLLLTSKPSAAR
jgi:hypothetical protein